jgi:glycosyltransferase involved in cell wall biosynthesis
MTDSIPQQANISLVIPAYQEEKRIAHTIDSLSTYLEKTHPGTELIVVCDGCTDGTAATARSSFKSSTCTLKVIELTPNQGKGAAVQAGMLEAKGDYIFFTDADLSFEPELLELFLHALLEGADVAAAQRKKETKYPGLGRKVLAKVSRFLVGNLVLPGMRDTQAGYKGFKREAARYLFKRLKTKRFLFDLEILMRARKKGYRIEKVLVDWKDQPGSTVRLYVDTMRAARDLIFICTRSFFESCFVKDQE